MVDNQAPCPCGSGLAYGDCCGPSLAGTREAPTAEALMRSRYTAYAVGATDYIRRTWHPSTRPEGVEFDADTRWLGLSVERIEAGQASDTRGTVEFTATCSIAGRRASLREASRFLKEADRWFYLDGEAPGRPVTRGAKIGRNAPCPCGSGKKYKHCCGAAQRA